MNKGTTSEEKKNRYINKFKEKPEFRTGIIMVTNENKLFYFRGECAMQKNDFELICEKMGKCSKMCCGNPVICAKRFIRDYAHGDLNKLLKIKAEAAQMTYASFVLGLFSMTSLWVSSCSLVLTIVKNQTGLLQCIQKIIAIMLAVCLVKLYSAMKEFKNVRKYEDYIKIAIEEIEKEYCKL